MKDLLTLVLAGGRGTRLRPLTDRRAKPVVPFAGRRLIDYTLGNCVRSGIRRTLVLAQYRAASVVRHLRSVAGAEPIVGDSFRGTADAVRVVLASVPPARRVLVLAGDHVYRFDYRLLLDAHEAARAECTLSAVPVRIDDAAGLGVLSLGPEGRVAAFVEKPNGFVRRPGRVLASMGIYVFDGRALAGFLADHPDAIDFGRDVIPAMVAEGRRLFARPFRGRWRDIADVDAYHRCHVESGCCVHDEAVLMRGASAGTGAKLRCVVVEEGIHIPSGTVIGYDREEDARRWPVTPRGVVVVTRLAAALPWTGARPHAACG